MTIRTKIFLSTLLAAAAQGQDNWMQQSPTISPRARFGAVMAYDSLHQVTVLFSGDGSLNDTWLWNGSARTWTKASPVHQPPGRVYAQAAYDQARQQLVLFGGAAANGSLLGDTWVWDGTDWTQKSPATQPPARYESTMTYDALHGQVVLFGGDGAGENYLNDTWVWDGTNWTKKLPVNSPVARDIPVMAYDAATQQTVLYGGRNGEFGEGTYQELGDTWCWDGSNWTQQNPATSPPLRLYPGMAYDSDRQKVVLFGGFDPNANDLADTWLWDGFTWTQLTLATNPSPRDGAAGQLAYDSGQQEIVLFGGFSSIAGKDLADTWTLGAVTSVNVSINVPAGLQFTFNGQSYTGSQTIDIAPGSYSVSTTSPQATGAGAQAVFLSWSDGGALSHTVTVGAANVSLTGTFKTQYLLTSSANPSDGGSISLLGNVTTGPYFDAGTLVSVFETPAQGYNFTGWSGACGGTGACFVTMSAPATVTANFARTVYTVSVNVPAGVQYSIGGFPFTGSGTIVLPPGSYFLSIASPQATAAGTQQTFVSWSDGGAQSHNLVVIASSLTVTGAFKTQYQLTTVASPATGGSVVGGGFYDAGSGVPVIAIATPGYALQYWSGGCTGVAGCFLFLNGPQTVTGHFGPPFDWVQLLPADSPSSSFNGDMVYDEARGVSLAFGSEGNLAQTWVFDGANWTLKQPANSPPDRNSPVLAYDRGNSQVVLFGGNSDHLLNDTWVWDGMTWTQKLPVSSPPGRISDAMAFDAARGKTVLFGGLNDADVSLNDTWLWDGINWTEESPAHRPSAREDAAMAYDSVRQVVVLFGGIDGNGGSLNDTWLWNGADWAQQSPQQRPPANASGTMAFDAAHQQMVLFDVFAMETWIWDGSNWSQSAPPQSPYPIQYSNVAIPMTFDSLHQDLVLFSFRQVAADGLEIFQPQTWTWLVPSVNLTPQAPTAASDGQGNYLVTVTLKNQGNVPLSSLFVNSAKLGSVAASGFVGGSFLFAIEPGATGSFTAIFPMAAIASKTAAVSFQGTYNAAGVSGASWSASARSINLP